MRITLLDGKRLLMMGQLRIYMDTGRLIYCFVDISKLKLYQSQLIIYLVSYSSMSRYVKSHQTLLMIVSHVKLLHACYGIELMP